MMPDKPSAIIESLRIDTSEQPKRMDYLTDAILASPLRSKWPAAFAMPGWENLKEFRGGDYQIVVRFNPPYPMYAVNLLEGHSGRLTMGFEFKTLSDAYGSWNPARPKGIVAPKTQARLDEQVFTLLDRVHVGGLIIEDGELHENVDPKRLTSLKTHLARLNMEVLPVIWTEGPEHTARILVHFMERLIEGEFHIFQRPVERVAAAVPHLGMLMSIPEVGPDLAKKIFAKYSNMDHFLRDCKAFLQTYSQTKKLKELEIHTIINIPGIGTKTAESIARFVTARWGVEF